MGKSLLSLAAFTTIMMLLAVLAVMKYSAPMTVAFGAVFIVSVLLGGTLVWRDRKQKRSGYDGSDKSRSLKWLFAPFSIGAIGALVMALRGGWNAGDTIGAIFFGIFALLIAYELLRRRRATHSR